MSRVHGGCRATNIDRQNVFMVISLEIYRLKNTTVFFMNFRHKSPATKVERNDHEHTYRLKFVAEIALQISHRECIRLKNKFVLLKAMLGENKHSKYQTI